MRRFIARFLLGTFAAWFGSAYLPGVAADRAVTTYILVGLFLAIGEIILPLVEAATAVVSFFLPRSVRIFLLRAAEVAVTARLVSGFGFTDPQRALGVVGFTILLSLLFLLPGAR